MRFDPLRPRDEDRPGSGTRLDRVIDPLTVAVWLLGALAIAVWVVALVE